jgi:transcriptional regulator with AAA-type ATPase domain/tetratricopeptide (TPR) repeat protein
MASLSDLIGESQGLVDLRAQVRRLLSHQTGSGRLPAVLVQGETGTGKGVLARALHQEGPRSQGPFVDVNCAALPETLLEAEMFGFERGAFTDARQAKPGLFQAAHHGTLFLDEVGALPPALQPKLLKAIEEHSVRRLGSTRSEPVDVWIISATNEDLVAAVTGGRFREDLYHRLATFVLCLPPLRDRGHDIARLAEHLLARACLDYELPAKSLSTEARELLPRYRWPGNVRELANMMERAALLAEGQTVTAAHLGLPIARSGRQRRAPAPRSLEEAGTTEREGLLAVLNESGWNLSRAAALLGMPRNTLRYRMDRYGLQAEAPAPLPVLRELSGVAASAGAAGIAAPGVRWERRRLSLLRVMVLPTPEPPSASVVNRALEVLIEKVESFGGRIEELSPAGIVGVFGLDPLEDAPSRAAHAILAVRKAAVRSGEGLAGGFTGRAAIHHGELLIGRAGALARIDPGDKTRAWAVLDAVLRRAGLGSIAVSQAAAPFLARRFDLEPAGETPGGEMVYRLVPAGDASRRPVQRPTPFVGRATELGALHDLVAKVRAGRGHVVGVVGEAGAGKSRLVAEFRRTLGTEEVAWLEGHGEAHGRSTPYASVLEILRASLGIGEMDPAADALEKLLEAPRRAATPPDEILPFVRDLLGLGAEDDPVRHLDPRLRRQRTFAAIRALLAGPPDGPARVIVFEDLHSMDRSTEDFLAYLVESLAGVPALVLTTQRPGLAVPWADRTHYRQITLDLLTEAEAEALIAGMLGVTELPPGLARAIWSRADGNPLFIEEITRALVEQGGLIPSEGSVRWSGAAVVETPATVEDIVRARIDQLEPGVKQTLQRAAVIGRDFSLALLGLVAGGSGRPGAHPVERDLEVLGRHELIQERRFVPEVEYTFNHAVIHDVAYQSLLARQRQEVHAAVARALETLHGERREEQAAALAHHWFRSGQPERGIEYALLAGDRAVRLFAHAEATAHYEQALAAARAQPASPPARRRQIDAALRLAGVGLTRQDLDRDRRNLEAARDLAEELGDEARLSRVLYWLGRLHYVLWTPATAVEYARRSLGIADRLGDEALAAPAVNLIGRICWQQSRYAEAGPMMERSVEQLRRLGDRTEAATAAAFAGFVFGFLGEFDRALGYADEGLRIAREIRNPSAEATALHHRGTIHTHRGAWEAAIADYAEATRIATQTGDLVRTYLVRLSDGWAHTASGDPGRGRTLLEEAGAMADHIGARFGLAWQRTYLAASLLALGDLDAARTCCEEAIGLAEETRDEFPRAVAHRTLAEILARRPDTAPGIAERAILAAIRIQEEIGARPELARSLLSHARLLEAGGDAARAAGLRARATAMFRSMRMTWDLARAQADQSTAAEAPREN